MYKAVCSSTSSWHMLQYKAYVRTWIGYLRAGDSARPSRRAVKSWEATEMQKQAREPHLTDTM